MWIFTTGDTVYNLDSCDRIWASKEGTLLIKDGYPSRIISKDDVREVIKTALRNGDNYVEVE